MTSLEYKDLSQQLVETNLCLDQVAHMVEWEEETWEEVTWEE